MRHPCKQAGNGAPKAWKDTSRPGPAWAARQPERGMLDP